MLPFYLYRTRRPIPKQDRYQNSGTHLYASPSQVMLIARFVSHADLFSNLQHFINRDSNDSFDFGAYAISGGLLPLTQLPDCEPDVLVPHLESILNSYRLLLK